MINLQSNWLRKLASASVLSYTALAVGWAIAHKLVGDEFWLLALANGFAIYLFAPLPLMALLAALARRRTTWAALLIPVLLFFGLFGADLTPPAPVVRAGGNDLTLTVMTYNVLYTNTDAVPIVASVAAAGPDLIAFQELTPLLARQLEREIGARYPYRTPLHPAACYAEVAIWSRYPLQVESVDDEILCRVRPVVVEVEGLRARVVDVHAWSYTTLDQESVERGFRWRREQIEWVLKAVEGKPEPLILLGDLNSTPMHEVYYTLSTFENGHSDGTLSTFENGHSDGALSTFENGHSDGTLSTFENGHSDGTLSTFENGHSDGALSTHLVDSFREAGWGLGHTFPATGGRVWNIPHPGRLVRIDHIFHSDDWQAEAAWVGEWDGASDHRPVIARLRLPRPE
ncbi:MAG: endonuclease/exonuclease/phosphatase family protein [Chloroflexota bacterium]|nr:endonuclease/exonuclease/phosphatase family protein [Chloroflexota bacterium]